jgi:hypothetical protein
MPIIPPTNAASIRDLRTVGRNRTLVVLATGPSIREIEDLGRLKGAEGVDTLAINRGVPELEPTDFLLFQDAATYVRLKDYLPTCPSVIMSGFRAMPGDVPNAVFFTLRQGMGWSRDLEGGFFVGKSSTYAALQVAAWMNYRRVFVLGCDMGAAPDGSLWRYGTNPDIGREERLARFAVEARFFDFAATALTPEERSRFVFASSYNRFPFVDKFTRADHRGIVEEILRVSQSSAIR